MARADILRCRCSAVILLIYALPASYVDQRRCDLAEQSFHEARELDPASRARLHERRLLVEQAWLVMFGFARHYGLSPFLIRTGESLTFFREEPFF